MAFSPVLPLVTFLVSLFSILSFNWPGCHQACCAYRRPWVHGRKDSYIHFLCYTSFHWRLAGVARVPTQNGCGAWFLGLLLRTLRQDVVARLRGWRTGTLCILGRHANIKALGFTVSLGHGLVLFTWRGALWLAGSGNGCPSAL